MKVAKLVLGILTILFSVIVTFQSCAAGVSNALEKNDSASGSAGLFVSMLMLTGAIVMIATRNSSGKGASIAAVIIFGLAALLAYPNSSTYGDLVVWGTLCVILAVVNLIAAIKTKKSPSGNNNDPQ
ncbi:hypothetical protein [uncultured Ruminococcus sp.]|uniref:hypothetical protein n=1 Tax=uncultured Ruminococcus sp. TaxID=165186 RepID=UPI000EBE222C|nr:hypothetical protein [uncultured Ruminococcus sp.]HCJ41064.1 hypothetical protein [Ruminococcus sp.]